MLTKVRNALKNSGGFIEVTDIDYSPKESACLDISTLSPEASENVRKLIEALEDYDDVQRVFHNVHGEDI